MSKGRAEAAAGAPGILLKYLQEQNRPYSAQDVFGNLQREHGLGKAAVVKALEQLAQQGKIKEKVYGKQKIYFADQDQFDMVSDADLQGLDAKIVALTAKVQSLQQSCRHMEAELKELTSALTTPEMQKEIQELKKECAGYTERLQNIKAATNHVTPEEKEQATELFDAILEGYPRSKKQFFVSAALPPWLRAFVGPVSFSSPSGPQEEVGIETDEDHKVTLPDP
uniref:Homologous-pairing protein 2 homolog n=1 Tax=Sus scrofa TaxID=9823 RepID=A0A8D1VPG3_PIG